MNKILRLLALLPLFLLLSYAPAPRATAQTASVTPRVFLPVVNRPSTSFSISRLGPVFGRVLGVGQDPFNSSVVYAMTYGSGMYKSYNAGASWYPISKGLTYLTLQSMAVDPVNPDVLYVGTYGDAAYSYNGVFKSTNGGLTWEKTGDMVNNWNGASYRNPVVYALAVDPNNPNRIFAGTRMKGLPSGAYGGGGVFRSENGGVSWTPVNDGLPTNDLYVYDLAIDADHPGLIYAAMHQSGLYRSYDYGEHWQMVDGYWGENVERPWSGRVISIDPNNSNTLYFGAMKNQGAYRSDDRGASWKRIGEGWWDVAVGAISPDPYHQDRIYVGVIQDTWTSYLKRSPDRGASWSTAANLNSWGRVAFAPDGTSGYVSVDMNGVFKTTNGGQSWYLSSRGITGYSVTGLSVSARNPKVMFASLYGLGVYVTKDSGVTWTSYSSGLGTKDLTGLTVDPRNPSVIYVTTTDSGVYVTQNGAGSWAPLTGGFPAALSLEQPRDVDPFENRPLPERDDLLEDPDAPLPRPANVMAGLAQANTLAVSPFDSNVLAGTKGRGIVRLVWPNWVSTTQTTGTAYAIVFDHGTSGSALAAVDGGSGSILASTDNGKTWVRSNTGLAGRTVYSLVQHPGVPGLFIAGTDSGVYYSENGGKTWASGGLTGEVIKAVGMHPGGLYYAGTDKTGYYTTSFNHPWSTVTTALNNVGVQGIVTGPVGTPQYFITRLGGIVRVRAE